MVGMFNPAADTGKQTIKSTTSANKTANIFFMFFTLQRTVLIIIAQGVTANKQKNPVHVSERDFGWFELSGTNKKRLKKEFFIYPINLLLQLFFEVLLS